MLVHEFVRIRVTGVMLVMLQCIIVRVEGCNLQNQYQYQLSELGISISLVIMHTWTSLSLPKNIGLEGRRLVGQICLCCGSMLN